ncbi:hypothetical protein DSECCO2_409140 [anaerobic digester metagenome]
MIINLKNPKKMTRPIKLLVLICMISLFSKSGFSQMSVSYYSSSLSKIGVGYDFNEKFWGELRLYSNTEIDDITPELVFCYNFINKEKHKTYVGFGGNVNYFTGLVLPIGLQFTPCEKLNGFSLHIELQPTLDFDNDLILQSSWGLRYKFGKND